MDSFLVGLWEEEAVDVGRHHWAPGRVGSRHQATCDFSPVGHLILTPKTVG